MRKLTFNFPSFFTATLILLLSACRLDSGFYQGTSSAMADAPPSPALMKYAEDLAYSWNSRAGARSWKTETDDVRNGQPVHILTEAVCPDRYHVLFGGPEAVDSYYIGTTLYEKKGKAAWSHRTLPMPNINLNGCKLTPEKVDPARVRILADSLRGLDLTGPEVREINGHKCREWVRKDSEHKINYPMTSCFDINTHELVESVNGTTKTSYYWNIPLEIKAPI